MKTRFEELSRNQPDPETKYIKYKNDNIAYSNYYFFSFSIFNFDFATGKLIRQQAIPAFNLCAQGGGDGK